MIDKKTFKGGIHPRETMGGKSVTGQLAVVPARPPEKVAILLSQNAGTPCAPIVKVGQRVLMHQKVGEPSGFVGSPVHASVSGKVVAIQPRVNAMGATVPAVVIENDGLDEWDDSVKARKPENMEIPQLLEAIKEAGIVGLGGAGFPTHVKLAPPSSAKIDTLILNGAECEPYLTSDHRTMVEHADLVVDGGLIAQRILSARYVVIAIEDNKPDAVEAIKKACEGKEIEVCVLPVKYPQGGEKQLIQVVTGRQVPSGKLPMDAGCVVINVATAAAISKSLHTGRPLIERILTVTGDIERPQNLRVRIGESIGSLIDQCGGLRDGVNKVILGGPMMGFAAFAMDTPVIKGTSGILLMRDHTKEKPLGNCIRCAKCASVCPIRLMPMTLNALSTHGRFEEARAYHAMDCVECGACAFICPAKLPLAQSIRVAKREIMKMPKQ